MSPESIIEIIDSILDPSSSSEASIGISDSPDPDKGGYLLSAQIINLGHLPSNLSSRVGMLSIAFSSSCPSKPELKISSNLEEACSRDISSEIASLFSACSVPSFSSDDSVSVFLLFLLPNFEKSPPFFAGLSSVGESV